MQAVQTEEPNQINVVGLYFVGSSTEDGNWIAANGEEYSLETVLQIVKDYGYKEKLKIVSNCDFSGKWVDRAKKIW